MFDLVFHLLLTTLALSGNQVYELDFRLGGLGEPAPAELYSYRLAHPFENRTQATNFAILCASLDWNAARYLPKEPLSPDDMRLYCGYYLSLPPTANSMRFIEQCVLRWQTNWMAGPVEEALLQRLWVEAPKLADELWCKLAANPGNVRSTRWAVWKSLMRDRRKAEAGELATREQIKTEIESSSSFICLPFQEPDILLFRPDKVRNTLYRYNFSAGQWIPSAAYPPIRDQFVMAFWKAPQGKEYQRSWKKGPSWQITYAKDGNTLVRTAHYVEADSYISGAIDGHKFTESIVELSQPPKSAVVRAPHYIELQ